MASVSVLDAFLYGEAIGTLTHTDDGRILFAFNQSYIEDENRPVLSLSFKDEFGQLNPDASPTSVILPPFFSNLLPEGPMRDYLAERAGVNPKREFFLLGELGADLPGAITVAPADGDALPLDAGDDDGDDTSSDQQVEGPLRFSLAGVQLKFSALMKEKGGLTISASGQDGSWIVKLPSPTYPGLHENEFSMMTLARMIGMNVPPIQLVDPASIENLPDSVSALDGQALAIERFDRLSDGSAVHIEDFAQIFSVYPEDKYSRGSYQSIATVIGAEGDHRDIAEFIRRLTFSMLIGNGDMHLKNWSVIYHDRRTASIAPAYDLVSTVHYLPSEEAALKMSRSRLYASFTADELRYLAAKARLPEKLVLDTAQETAERFHQYWGEEKANLPLSKAAIEAIDVHLAKLRLF